LPQRNSRDHTGANQITYLFQFYLLRTSMTHM